MVASVPDTTLAPVAIDQMCINTIRTLAMDAVEQANSGHPGAPMGAAPMAYTLWTRFLKHNPRNPRWPDRDRFVLSAGHASMLLYALLHLTGYDLPLSQLEQFRQWGSHTPGHPEFDLTPGVEVTTGPLGQGFGTAVGMAMATHFLAARFNRPGYEIVDHHVYALCSDGDLEEGLSHEAASLAGHLGLGRLIVLHDDNHITIEGDIDLACSDDVVKRFEGYHWHVLRVEDGNDLDAIDTAIVAARQVTDRPSLIAVRTHIGYPAPHKQDTAEAHGAPLGAEEVRATKSVLGWPSNEPFYVPIEAVRHMRQAIEDGQRAEHAWVDTFASYARVYPEAAAEWCLAMEQILPDGWDRHMPSFTPEEGAMATRQASGQVLNAIAPFIPTLIGGSADLAPSTNTLLRGEGDFAKDAYGGRNIHWGVREHGMGAALNGMALHGGLYPYGATFLIFSDYMRPAIRLACLMGQHVLYVFTHDSIGLGEDGPTHQPIETLATLRAIPNMTTIRPGDANETAGAWRTALIHRDGPVALVLTRQKVPVLRQTAGAPVERGAYVLQDAANGVPEIILLASGSELQLIVAAHEELGARGIQARVVSVPSLELFLRQPASYRDQVLPPGVRARLAVEAATPQSWHQVVGLDGDIIGLTHFGASAPAQVLFEQFGFTVEHVLHRALSLVGARLNHGIPETGQ